MLPRWNNITAPEELMQQKGKEISALQISRLRYVGSNPVTRETIESSFIRFIDLFDKHLKLLPFLLGNRPSSCDFAVYGQLTCLALFDPTPQKLILERAPRVYAWTELLEDLSGYELIDRDYLDVTATNSVVPETLLSIIAEVGRVYVPYLLANADAVMNKKPQMEIELDGRLWTQQAFPYQLKCLKWLRDEYESLENGHQNTLDRMLKSYKILNLFI